MTVHDIFTARNKLRATLNQRVQNDSAKRLAYNSSMEDQAILIKLTASHYEDTQLYAAVDDVGPHPETGKAVRGFHVLKFAAGIGSDALPYQEAKDCFFYPFDDFKSRFAGTGGIVKESLCSMFEKFSADMRDPHGYAEICRRRIDTLERVTRGGLYNRNIDRLRFEVKTGDYVLTPVGGFPDVMIECEAQRRIYRVEKGDWKPLPL